MAEPINIPAALIVPSQIPLDWKLYSRTLLILQDLGASNNFAYKYYAGMIVFCLENLTHYIWMERPEGYEVDGLLGSDFVYPPGVVANDINYGNKSYNFFNYLLYWLGQNGFNNSALAFKFKSTMLDLKDPDFNNIPDGHLPQIYYYDPSNVPMYISYKTNVFYTEQPTTLYSEIHVGEAVAGPGGDFVVLDTFLSNIDTPAYPGEFQPDPFQLTGDYQLGVLYIADMKTVTGDGLMLSQSTYTFRFELPG